MLRAQLEPEQVYVIPNALVADNYAPSPTPPSTDTSESFHSSRQLTPVNIIIMSRLVYRKGIDLLVAAAPQICDLHPQVRFIVGGDGPKMVELEQMREKYQLQDRIELLGSIPPSGVRDVSGGSIRLPERANARVGLGRTVGARQDETLTMTLTLTLTAGAGARAHLPQYVPHRGIRDQHHRGGLDGVVRRRYESGRRPRDPAGGYDRVLPGRRGRCVPTPTVPHSMPQLQRRQHSA